MKKQSARYDRHFPSFLTAVVKERGVLFMLFQDAISALKCETELVALCLFLHATGEQAIDSLILFLYNMMR